MGIYKVGKNLNSIARSGTWADTLEEAKDILAKKEKGYHIYHLVIDKKKDMIKFERL